MESIFLNEFFHLSSNSPKVNEDSSEREVGLDCAQRIQMPPINLEFTLSTLPSYAFDINNQELWFQQDGATCHTARATIDLLKDTFGDRLISRFGPVNWPPRSCGSTPLDYFLWGYVKSLVYADKPQTLDHLEDNIHRVIADIRPQMLEKVIENWTSRLDYIRASRGSPMPEIIFKMFEDFIGQPERIRVQHIWVGNLRLVQDLKPTLLEK
ncbi:putative DD41D transposase [Trichonephila clavipes]|nr:putative DD41D transposase [Trichonephila clavipes]